MAVLRDKDGQITAIVCTRGRESRCEWCSARSTKLCDYPVIRNGKKTTCDKRICNRCGVNIAPEVDYCPPHYRYSTRG